MKPSKCAIPLYVTIGDLTHIGTGFLASRGGEIGLVTSGHVALGMEPFATGGWVGWPTEVLAAPDPSGDPVPVKVFTSDSTRRDPAFSFGLRNPASGWMREVIAFFDPVNESAFAELQETFDVVDLEAGAEEPGKGTSLIAVGYPDRGGTTRWPYSSPRKVSGTVGEEADDGVLEAALSLSAGFRGAPVFTSSEDFVGVVCGTEDGIARITTTAELRNL